MTRVSSFTLVKTNNKEGQKEVRPNKPFRSRSCSKPNSLSLDAVAHGAQCDLHFLSHARKTTFLKEQEDWSRVLSPVDDALRQVVILELHILFHRANSGWWVTLPSQSPQLLLHLLLEKTQGRKSASVCVRVCVWVFDKGLWVTTWLYIKASSLCASSLSFPLLPQSWANLSLSLSLNVCQCLQASHRHFLFSLSLFTPALCLHVCVSVTQMRRSNAHYDLFNVTFNTNCFPECIMQPNNMLQNTNTRTLLSYTVMP